MCLKIWPTTLTSKPLCLVCVPLWPAPYAISIATRLYTSTHVDNYITYITHLFLELFTFIIYIYQSNLFTISLRPVVSRFCPPPPFVSSPPVSSHFLQPLQQCRSPSCQFLRVLVPGLNPLSRLVESPPCLRLNPMFLDPMSQALC